MPIELLKQIPGVRLGGKPEPVPQGYKTKCFTISKNFLEVLHKATELPIEVGGYVKPSDIREKQELSIREGDPGQVCPLKPEKGTSVQIHTHPIDPSDRNEFREQLNRIFSPGDVLSFLTCPNEVTSVVVSNDEVHTMSKEPGKEIDITKGQVIERYQQAATGTDIIFGSTGSWGCDNYPNKCVEAAREVNSKVMKILKDEFGVASNSYKKGQQVEACY